MATTCMHPYRGACRLWTQSSRGWDTAQPLLLYGHNLHASLQRCVQVVDTEQQRLGYSSASAALWPQPACIVTEVRAGCGRRGWDTAQPSRTSGLDGVH
ncbi:hypothetical protein NQZ68_016892 [Dissostichus eleginoides]|nr:hypothetical protein NQZ68_016892 [Dissostichus eleginoides]